MRGAGGERKAGEGRRERWVDIGRSVVIEPEQVVVGFLIGEGVSVVAHESTEGDNKTQTILGLRFVITVKPSGLLFARSRVDG